MTKNQAQNLILYATVILWLLVASVIYLAVSITKINRRIDTTQQLIMESQCPVALDNQKVSDDINEIKWYLGYIRTTTDQIFESFPSYIYKQPNEYDGKICDDANYCQRYIFLDDKPYNDNEPTNDR